MEITLKTFPTFVRFIVFVEEKLCKSSRTSEVINSKLGAIHTQIRMFTVVGVVSLLIPIPLKPIPWLLFEHAIPSVCLPGGYSWGVRSVRLNVGSFGAVPFLIQVKKLKYRNKLLLRWQLVH